MKFIKKTIKDLIKDIIEDNKDKTQDSSKEDEQKISILTAGDLLGDLKLTDESVHRIGLFSDLDAEKTADIVYSLLQHMPSEKQKKEERQPVEFHISTYGGCADDMFAIYDLMKTLDKSEQEIHTTGWGKVMSAGVLLLAAGTKGKRKIGRNTRIMLHSVRASHVGGIHSLENEMAETRWIQKQHIDALVAETKMTKKELNNMLNKKVDVYLSAEDAIRLGIADIIV